MGPEQEVAGQSGQPGQASGQTGEPAAAAQVKQGETPRQQMRKAKQVTRRRFSAEEKIRVVMEGIRGDEPVSVICRKEGLQSTVYYRWLKDFMEAGKQRIKGDTLREAGRDEVRALQDENERLKQLVADYALELVAVKKSLLAEQ